jgi:hypothetical protein
MIICPGVQGIFSVEFPISGGVLLPPLNRIPAGSAMSLRKKRFPENGETPLKNVDIPQIFDEG